VFRSRGLQITGQSNLRSLREQHFNCLCYLIRTATEVNVIQTRKDMATALYRFLQSRLKSEHKQEGIPSYGQYGLLFPNKQKRRLTVAHIEPGQQLGELRT